MSIINADRFSGSVGVLCQIDLAVKAVEAEQEMKQVELAKQKQIKDRMKRAAELAENGDFSLDKYIEKRDKLRRTYYKTYTGREMGNANNYTICFDTGKISIPTCVDIIMKILEQE